MSQLAQFNWPLRVYYEDTDAGGIVYYANYLKFFERARTEWLRHAGINQQQLAREQQRMFVVKSTHLDYHLPAQLDDLLVIQVRLQKLGRASLVFIQECWRESDGQCLVSGTFKIACVSTAPIRPCAIPDAVLETIARSFSVMPAT